MRLLGFITFAFLLVAATLSNAHGEEREKKRNHTLEIPRKRVENCSETVVEECETSCATLGESEIEKYGCEKDCFQTNQCPLRALVSCQKAVLLKTKECIASDCLENEENEQDDDVEAKMDFFHSLFGCVRDCGRTAREELECNKIIPKVNPPTNRTRDENKPTFPPRFNRTKNEDDGKNKTKEEKNNRGGFFGNLFNKNGPGRLLRAGDD